MPCLVEGCGTISQQGGYCCVHGGGASCSVEGCSKYPRHGKGGMCMQYFNEAQDAASGN